MSSVPRWLSRWSAGTVAIVAGIVAFTATAGFTTSLIAPAVAGVILGLVTLSLVLWSPSSTVTVAAVPPGMRRLFAIGAPLLLA
ncbi:MAG: hypothetical protein M3541_18730 [Acidobacteriota bacterium]|nr:hypothetical protein [Acidobacteriota bacterium]MDQ3420777.1 hypothetical protein [Acidobacteriota bacterium]